MSGGSRPTKRANPATSKLRALRRQLRASRRVGELQLAEQLCAQILEQKLEDRRAIAVRIWLADKQGNSHAVDLGLAELAQAAEGRGFLRDRNRLALRRAFLRDQMGAPSLGLFEAALEQATASGDKYAVFLSRQGIAGALVRTGDPREIEPALETYLAAASAVGAEAHALGMVSAVAIGPSGSANGAAKLLWKRCLSNGEIGTALGWLRELVRRDPIYAAEGERLEILCIGRGLWAELAELYRLQAEGATAARRADRLSRLGELLEDELGRAPEAAQVYGEAAAAGLGLAAMKEQFRIHREAGDVAGARRCLDEGVDRATGGEVLAETLLLRARWRRAQQELTGASEDLEKALRSAPSYWPALLERAEIKTALGDSAGAMSLELALGRPGVGEAERAAGHRCLAKLYAGHLQRPAEARKAWERVHKEDPEARDAAAYLRAAYRQAGDKVALVDILKTELDRDPRGPEAGDMRRELARTLEAQGEPEAASVEWRKLLRGDPASPEALAALQERYAASGLWKETAELLENAVSAQQEPLARAQLMDKLAAVYGEHLGDAQRAQALKQRAETLRQPVA
jgi:tetratricopeptide (TPR) repeat protein